MDFWKLLGMAEDQQKEKNATVNEGRFFCTKIAPPQKDPKQKKLSENVKKFLQSKSDAQLAQERAAEEKKRKLFQLRAENKKSQRTMKAMLHMTKSSDKSALSDVKRSSIYSRQQCDEDDYGYESNEARAFFEKLMSKFEKSDEDPADRFTKSGKMKKISSIQETKNRVKERLANNDDDNVSHHVKSRKSDSDISSKRDDNKGSSKDFAKSPNRVKKKPAPPPPSFADLIRMAEEAKGKPVELVSKNVKDFEFDRPMTAKEKEEYLHEKASQARKIAKASGSKQVACPASVKLKRQDDVKGTSQVKSASQEGKDARGKGAVAPSTKNQNSSKEKENTVKNEFREEKVRVEIRKAPPIVVGPEYRPAAVKSDSKVLKPPSKDSGKPRPTESSAISSEKKHKAVKVSKDRQIVPDKRESVVKKVSAKPSSAKRKKSRSRSPDDIRHSSKRARSISRSPSPEFRRQKSTSSQAKKSNRIESDSEYDSEMDDFIDDSEANVDISAEIRSIFGYDRRRYRDEADFDDRSMECNRFSDVMREEARSAKIGRMEDLEDMRKEEEEKRRKMMKKKQRR